MLHENIKFARKVCGFTQQQVADFLGIKRSSYTYYENGHTPLPVDLLVPLSVLFGADVNWLMTHNLSFGSGDTLLSSWAERELPGLAKLTPQERELLLLLRKYDLTEKMTEIAQSMTGEQKEDE